MVLTYIETSLSRLESSLKKLSLYSRRFLSQTEIGAYSLESKLETSWASVEKRWKVNSPSL